MTAPVVILAVALVAAVALCAVLATAASWAKRSLGTALDGRRQAEATEHQAAQELAAARAELDQQRLDHGAAQSQAAADRRRMAKLQSQLEDAARTAQQAVQARRTAEAESLDLRGRLDELRVAEEHRAAAGAVDAGLLWALEQARTERTWRQSVATDPGARLLLDGSTAALARMLQVEVDAIREEVGTTVELSVDLPASLSPATCLLTLRTAQELLATFVHDVETAALQVAAQGDDVVVGAHGVDEDGTPVAPVLDGLAPVPGVEHRPGSVRLRGAAGRGTAPGDGGAWDGEPPPAPDPALDPALGELGVGDGWDGGLG